MADSDETKELLEKMLQALYAKSAAEQSAEATGDSYLIAADKQYLGRITENVYDQQSILNTYGPFGSLYSSTSIFNEYSQYGGQYGVFSLNNPYCQSPPQLFLRGRFVGNVSANQYVPNRISNKAFLAALKHDIRALLRGEMPKDGGIKREGIYLQAQDGQFLGNLNPNRFDQDSISNKFSPYGNKFSQTSIFNKFSTYGGQFSQLSPFNRISNTPPRILDGGKFVAYLTVNTMKTPRVDPNEVMEWAERNVRKRFG